ncbi:MAG: hypothetical protein K6A80_08035 [Saccharofermentans sp.]|nr:hypothetical protein [Saccharofermentans sp.]
MTAEKSFWEKNIVESPFKVGLLAVPFLLSLFVGWYLIGIDDTKYVLIWCAYLLLCGVAVLPLGAYIFRNAGSGGFILSQTMGVILVSIFVWTFTYIKIYRFNRILVFVAVFLIGIACYVIPPLRREFIKTIRRPFYIEKASFELLVFMLVLTILCYYKGFTPVINGQEKFMDYGFIMSMLRNDELPANDMWLSGYSINYYYFGQFLWALVIKISGTPAPVGYNLAMTSAIAIPFAMSFSIGTMLFDYMAEKSYSVKGIWAAVSRYVTGFLAGLAVTIFGNSHSFFYDEESFGNGLLQFFSKLGINVGKTDGFFYPDSTRFIGHNPDSKVLDAAGNVIDAGDYTIEEFPFYSFLVADLHAHVISMMVVLLIMGIAIAYIARTEHPDNYEFNVVPKRASRKIKEQIFKTEIRRLMSVELVLIAVLLGVAQQTSYWDFLIYFVFGSMALLLINTRRSKVFCDISSFICFAIIVAAILIVYLKCGSNPLLHAVVQLDVLFVAYLLVVFEPCALTRTGFGMSFLFSVAYVIALPFNYNFDMISNLLGKVIHNSSPYQLFILWGTHVLIALVFVIFTIVFKNYDLTSSFKSKKKKANDDSKPEICDIPAEGFSNPIAGFFGKRNLIDVFICGMTVVAIMLLAAPEIFYVRDIYTSGYLRSNTMFKFTFAAFIMLGIIISYAVVRMFWMITSKNKRSTSALIFGIVFILLILIVPGHYTSAGIKQRCGDTTIRTNYRGLNGTSYLKTYYSPYGYIEADGNLNSYLEAIAWLNNNVEGDPVILEAYGESYTDNNIVSAYTGLPTVIGWQTHEWLWRFHGIVDETTDLLISDPNYDVWSIYLTPRYNDVDMVYISDDPDAVQYVINKYQIEYIILGNLEYYRYNYDNTETLKQVGEIVFNSENLNIFKVTPVDEAAVLQ